MSRGQNCLICAAKVSLVSEIGAVPSVRISRDEIDLIEKMSTDNGHSKFNRAHHLRYTQKVNKEMLSHFLRDRVLPLSRIHPTKICVVTMPAQHGLQLRT